MSEKAATCRGAILRVDLTTGKISKEPISEWMAQNYLGGEGLNAWLFWQHFLKVTPRIEATSPDNVLIAGLGPLGGVGYGAGAKMKWTFKSPQTGMYGDSTCGGRFAGELRYAGYDHMVITGRAARPVYLWINDEKVEIRDASHLWGKNILETDDALKAELGDTVETACVAQAAENLVGFSAIVSSRRRLAGRTGGGCVMASKNLKAIAVRGSKGVPVFDRDGLIKAANEFIAAAIKCTRATTWKRMGGTITALARYQLEGANPWRNCQFPPMPDEKFQPLSHDWYRNNLYRGALACSPGCVAGCSSWYSIEGNESPAAKKYAGEVSFKPEYIPIASFGAMCDIPDMVAVAHLTNMCTEYGIDAPEMGTIGGFLMELWDRGIITAKDTQEWMGEPVTFEWGNYEAVEKALKSVARQDNELGRMFKDGVYKGALALEKRIKKPVLKYAVYGKGGLAFVEEIRHTPGWAVTMAVGSRGGDHMKSAGTLDKFNSPDVSKLYFGTPEGAEPLSTKLKGASVAKTTIRYCAINSLGICVLVAMGQDPILFPEAMFANALNAVTGMKLSGKDLLAIGERTANLEKAFNSRLGLGKKDDLLCDRWLNERLTTGYGKGWKAGDYLEELKEEYYQYMGWDKETSLQTRQKLAELGMDDVTRVLEKEKLVI